MLPPKKVPREGIAPTRATKDAGFTVRPAYFNGLPRDKKRMIDLYLLISFLSRALVTTLRRIYFLLLDTASFSMMRAYAVMFFVSNFKLLSICH